MGLPPSRALIAGKDGVERRLFQPDSRTPSEPTTKEGGTQISLQLEEEEDVPVISPAPGLTPVLAGAVAGSASTLVQLFSHTSGGRAFAPSPLRAQMPAIAVYFTSYEIIKAELGLSPSFGGPDHGQPDPRAALFNGPNTGRYFVAASAAGGLHHVIKMTLSPGNINVSLACASTVQIAARVGMQFSVFEQAKNAFALYRHRKHGEELNVGEVLAAATLGGVVAASITYPLQHVFPVHRWALTAPPPPVVGAPVSTTSTAAGPSGKNKVRILPRPTFLACLGRFLPACVATAVTYEYAYRFIRDRTRPSEPQQPNGPASTSTTSLIPIDSASIIHSPHVVHCAGAHYRALLPSGLPPGEVLPLRPPEARTTHSPPTSATHTHALGHDLPVVHTMPPSLWQIWTRKAQTKSAQPNLATSTSMRI